MYYLVGIIVILTTIIALLIVKLRKEKDNNLSLSNQLTDLGCNLTSQERAYSELITKGKYSDSLVKLKRMKTPHYKALQHINSIIREKYYKIVPPHKQPKLVE